MASKWSKYVNFLLKARILLPNIFQNISQPVSISVLVSPPAPAAAIDSTKEALYKGSHIISSPFKTYFWVFKGQ